MKPDADTPELRSALGELGGARLSLVLDVTEVNRPVRVTQPQLG